MMQELKIFENENFGAIRTVEVEGNTLLCATDVARCLGYTNPRKAVNDHCKGVTKCSFPTDGGIQEVNFIPEGDVYRLIVRSKLPQAEKFESWVFNEVLPSIRQTGGYGNLDIQSLVVEVVKQTVSEVTKQFIPLLLEKESGLKKKHDYRGPLERIDVDIRQELDEMLFSGRFTYAEVAVFLNENGVKTSYRSVERYAKKMGLR